MRNPTARALVEEAERIADEREAASRHLRAVLPEHTEWLKRTGDALGLEPREVLVACVDFVRPDVTPNFLGPFRRANLNRIIGHVTHHRGSPIVTRRADVLTEGNGKEGASDAQEGVSGSGSGGEG